MVKSSCSDNNMGLKKGPWTPEEDRILLSYIQQHGHGSWRSLPSRAGLQRCGKSCRLRWINYLRPDIKRGKFSLQEEQTIIQLHALLGNRWSAIASHLPKRTDNEIKNYWNTHLKKRLTKMGIDPISHKPKDLALDRFQSKEIATISHLAQWETARLQAEARLVRESKLPYRLITTAVTTPPAIPISRPPCLDILKVWEWINPGKDISSFILNGSQNLSITKPNNYEANGIMENSLELDRSTSDSTYVDGSLGFPSFIDGFGDLHPNNVVMATGSSESTLGGCWGVLEECKIWSMGSPMF